MNDIFNKIDPIEKTDSDHFFQKTFEIHRNGYAANGWSAFQSQITRFNAIIESAAINNTSLLDVGCGTADFLKYTKSRGIILNSYVGIDNNASAIDYASSAYIESKFFIIDVFDEKSLQDFCESIVFDFAIISGLFNLYSKSGAFLLNSVINNLFIYARRGVIFNCLCGEIEGSHIEGICLPVNDCLEILNRITSNVNIVNNYHPRDATYKLFKDEI